MALLVCKIQVRQHGKVVELWGSEAQTWGSADET